MINRPDSDGHAQKYALHCASVEPMSPRGFATCLIPCIEIGTGQAIASSSTYVSHPHRQNLNDMTKDEIISELRQLLRTQKQLKVDIDAIGADTRFDQVGFDSLSILDFMYEVENRFGAFPEMEELVKMQKVDDLINYLAANAKP